MKMRLIPLWILLIVTFLALATAPAADQDSCANLAKQKYDKVTITSSTFMNDPLGFLPPKTPGVFGTPPGLKVTAPFCRVAGFIEPVQNSHIEFEVWLPPAAKWNSRYFAVGNPAFEGAIKYQGLAIAIDKGYATGSTDTGHEDPGHKWAMGHPERVIDWTPWERCRSGGRRASRRIRSKRPIPIAAGPTRHGRYARIRRWRSIREAAIRTTLRISAAAPRPGKHQLRAAEYRSRGGTILRTPAHPFAFFSSTSLRNFSL
jgi:hypothetical protein